MNSGYISAFVDSVGDLFVSMLNGTVERSQTTVANERPASGELVAIIGLSGSLNGTVALMFPLQTAYNMVGALVGCEFNQVDDTVVDGVAEVANILVGSAKARLALSDGIPLELGLPTVVRGSEVCVNQPSGTIWVELHFKSSHGPFVLRIALRRAKASRVATATVTSRALIVDESVVMRKVLSSALARADVKHVDYADSAEKGAQLAAETPYDLIVVDCSDGFAAGLECVQRVRTSGIVVPVLIILAEADRAQSAVALNAGASDFIIKPFQPNVVAAKVRELLTDFWAKETALSEASPL